MGHTKKNNKKVQIHWKPVNVISVNVITFQTSRFPKGSNWKSPVIAFIWLLMTLCAHIKQFLLQKNNLIWLEGTFWTKLIEHNQLL